MYVFDTDTLSRLHADDPRLRQRQERLEATQVATTAVTRIEILQGRFDFILKSKDGDQLLRAFAWLARSEELLRHILVLPINASVAAHFDRLRQNKKLKKARRRAAHGFKDGEKLKKEPDLGVLRDRADFLQLVAKVDKGKS